MKNEFSIKGAVKIIALTRLPFSYKQELLEEWWKLHLISDEQVELMYEFANLQSGNIK